MKRSARILVFFVHYDYLERHEIIILQTLVLFWTQRHLERSFFIFEGKPPVLIIHSMQCFEEIFRVCNHCFDCVLASLAVNVQDNSIVYLVGESVFRIVK